MPRRNLAVCPTKLTPRQAEALECLKRRIASGFPSSSSELATDMGYKSFSSVHHFLRTLARKGYIAYEPGETRGIRLLKEYAAPVPAPGTLVESVGLLGKAALVPAKVKDIVGKAEKVFRVDSDNLKHSGVRRRDYVVKDAEGRIVAVARRMG